MQSYKKERDFLSDVMPQNTWPCCLDTSCCCGSHDALHHGEEVVTVQICCRCQSSCKTMTRLTLTFTVILDWSTASSDIMERSSCCMRDLLQVQSVSLSNVTRLALRVSSTNSKLKKKMLHSHYRSLPLLYNPEPLPCSWCFLWLKREIDSCCKFAQCWLNPHAAMFMLGCRVWRAYLNIILIEHVWFGLIQRNLM